METTKKTSRLDEVLQKGRNAVANVKASISDYRTIPGYSNYEVNSKGIVRRKGGAVQSIPTGKKKYLLYNDKKERRQIDPSDLKKLFDKKAPAKKSAKTGERSKKDIILSMSKQGKTAKQISDETGYAYNTVYVTIKINKILSLHESGKTPKEISELTGFSVDSIKWQISK